MSNPFTSQSGSNTNISSIFSKPNSGTNNIFGAGGPFSLNVKPDEKVNKNGGTNLEGNAQGKGSLFSNNPFTSGSSLLGSSNVTNANLNSSSSSQLFWPSSNPFSMGQQAEKKTTTENAKIQSIVTSTNSNTNMFGYATNPIEKTNTTNTTNTTNMFSGVSQSQNMFGTAGSSSSAKVEASSNLWNPNQTDLSKDTKVKQTVPFVKPLDHTATIKQVTHQNNKQHEQTFTPPILDPSIFITAKQAANPKSQNLNKQTEPQKKTISNSQQKSVENSFQKKSFIQQPRENYDYLERLKIDDEGIREDLKNGRVHTSKDKIIKQMESERDKIKQGIIKNLQAQKNKVNLNSHTQIVTKKLQENIRSLQKQNADFLNEKKALQIEIEQIEKTLNSLKAKPIDLPKFETPKMYESMKVSEYQEQFYKFLPDSKQLQKFQKIKSLRQEKERLSEEVEEAERTVNDLEFEESEKIRRLHNIDFEVIDIFNEDQEFESYCNEGFGVQRENLDARYRELKEQIKKLKNRRSQDRNSFNRSTLIL